MKLYEVLQTYKQPVAFTTQSKHVLYTLNNDGIYTPDDALKTSYQFINKYYGFNPIFLFKFNAELTEEEFYNEVNLRFPVCDNKDILIFDYTKLDVAFDGEYYEWCDLHLLLNDVIGYVPTTPNLLDVWNYLSQSPEFNDEGLTDEIVTLYNGLDSINTRLNLTPYNLQLSQVIARSLTLDSLLYVIPK